MKRSVRDDSEIMKEVSESPDSFRGHGDGLLEHFRDMVDVKDSFEVEFGMRIPLLKNPSIAVYELVKEGDISQISIEIAEDSSNRALSRYVNSGMLQRCSMEDDGERIMELLKARHLRVTSPTEKICIFGLSPQAKNDLENKKRKAEKDAKNLEAYKNRMMS